MAIYNLTQIAAANSTLDVLKGVNGLVSWFPIMVGVAIMTIIMFNLSYKHPSAGVMVAGFILTNIMGLLWLAGYVPFMVLIYSMIILTLGALAVIFFTKDG